MRNIAIYGAGGMGKEAREIIRRCNDHKLSWSVVVFLMMVVKLVQKWAVYGF